MTDPQRYLTLPLRPCPVPEDLLQRQQDDPDHTCENCFGQVTDGGICVYHPGAPNPDNDPDDMFCSWECLTEFAAGVCTEGYGDAESDQEARGWTWVDVDRG